MIYIFVDTNIYVGAGYNFNNTFFSAIERFAKDEEVVLLTCSICEKEVMVHIRQDVEEIVKPLNKTLKKGIFAAVRSSSALTNAYRSVDEESVQKTLINEYRDYLKRVNSQKFSIEDISVEELMDDYFEMRAPFEPSKPKEFKDAIMIKSLKSYQEKLGETIHIVSDDGGFRAAFEDNENFIVHDFYKKFLRYVQKEEVCRAFEVYYFDEFNEDTILELVTDFFRDCTYFAYDYPDFYVTEISKLDNEGLEFLYCEIVNDTTAKIHLLVDIDVTVSARYMDEDNSIYDHEEKEYLYKSFIETVEVHRVQKEIIFIGSYNTSELDDNVESLADKYSCEIISIDSESNDYEIALDEETLIKVIHSESVDSASDRKYLMENSEYCSECGKRIGFIGSAIYRTYNEEPLCDSCMEDNDYGFVCPNCGLKYPEDLRGASGMFCIDCEAELDI